MRIGQLAEATGTTTRALRHYEQEGPLPSARATNGCREYPEEAIRRAQNIRERIDALTAVHDALAARPGPLRQPA
jgi:DNA-binding transcriptional MerR regulator